MSSAPASGSSAPSSIEARADRVVRLLHGASYRHGAEQFRDTAMAALREAIPFRSAWWGMARSEGLRSHTLHVSLPWHLPDGFVEAWEAMKGEDAVAEAALLAPDRTILVGAAEIAAVPALTELATRFDIGNAATTVSVDATSGLVTFLSLYRGAAESPFSEAERALKERVMPHLILSWHANWLQELGRARLRTDSANGALALADRRGFLHVTDGRFGKLLQREWPQWRGPLLPGPVRDAIGCPDPVQTGSLLVRSAPSGDLHVLECVPAVAEADASA
jgi:hypothetical protein